MSIFINYRRNDTDSITGRIDDHLRNEFGNEAVFRDIDSIPLGVDFVTHLSNEVSKCKVFLAIIGKSWLDARLYDKSDFVRIEIEAALSRGIPVIPITVEGASLPKLNELPESLRPLLKRNGISIGSGRTFNSDMLQLVEGIRAQIDAKTDNGLNRQDVIQDDYARHAYFSFPPVAKPTSEAPSKGTKWRAAALISALASGVAIVYALVVNRPSSEGENTVEKQPSSQKNIEDESINEFNTRETTQTGSLVKNNNKDIKEEGNDQVVDREEKAVIDDEKNKEKRPSQKSDDRATKNNIANTSSNIYKIRSLPVNTPPLLIKSQNDITVKKGNVGFLSSKTISAVINSHRYNSQIQACYGSELSVKSEQITVRFFVSSTGKVASASVTEGTIRNAQAEKCVLKAIKSWRFPKPTGGKGVAFTYPIALRQQSARAPNGLKSK